MKKKLLLTALIITVAAGTAALAACDSPFNNEMAVAAAFSDLGITQEDVTGLTIDHDRENGRRIIEVEFIFNGFEYEYEIDAESGKVISTHIEPVKGSNGGNFDPGTGSEGAARQAALNAALADAGLTAEQVRSIEIEREDGGYEVDFYNGLIEYEYFIVLKDGASTVISKTFDIADGSGAELPLPDAGYISQQAAIDAAKAHFSVTDTVKGLSVSITVNQSSAYYEVEFKRGGYEYECKIDANSGNVFDAESERD